MRAGGSFPELGRFISQVVDDNEEDWACTTYLVDTVVQAGRAAKHLYMEEIGWDPPHSSFVDLQGEAIEHLFKLYPWEWLMREEFGAHLTASRTQLIEPHVEGGAFLQGIAADSLGNLSRTIRICCPRISSPGRLSAYAKKPLYSREGANIELYSNNECLFKADGPYGSQGHIYQALQILPCFDGHYAVIGSWVIDGQSAGMCIREDSSPLSPPIPAILFHTIS